MPKQKERCWMLEGEERVKDPVRLTGERMIGSCAPLRCVEVTELSKVVGTVILRVPSPRVLITPLGTISVLTSPKLMWDN